jgi:non-lysosomal glucosylceramidase
MKRLSYILLLVTFTAHAQTDPSHHVPENKNLSGTWNKSLYADDRGPFTGDQLKTIGMPCGGIASGQLYVRGDGTLAGWWIANNAYNTGYGHHSTNNFMTALGPWQDCYQTFTPPSYIDEGFTLNGRPLDAAHFDAIEFTGEYPIATIDYKDKKPLPVAIRLQVFSPFIPLDARESATPGTVLQFILRNTSDKIQTVTLAGHVQNPVGLDGKGQYTGTSRNIAFHENGLTGIVMDLVNTTLPALHAWNGNVCLSLIGDGTTSSDMEKPLGEQLIGEVGKKITLKPGESKTLTFLLAWYFPNRPHYVDVEWTKPLSTKGELVGNQYANWFSSSRNVAEWLKSNSPRLQKETFAFHDAYYNQSTLPYWLNRRLIAPMSTLATETCQWWATGKFYAWEGVGSCIGTCTHVWNYEQGLAHFFPELERNIREQTDFGSSFQADGGIITRDGNPQYGLAIDGQCGTVLKAYREDLLSRDHIFLARNWTKIKAAMNYLIRLDQNADGIIDGTQGNTYDDQFYGANTYVGGLYLAALKAAASMARTLGDPYAGLCDLIAGRGAENTGKRLYNGEYFIQDVDLKAHPEAQYGRGCLSDQLFGQTWASLYGLGSLYPEPEIKSALNSIWTYNWAPDVSVQTKYHPAERDYASHGEAGLLVCTWPHDPHPGDHGVRYRDEVWTGIEYQVATSMIYHGMLNEGLSVVRGLDDRYQPEKHNPWNEVECGDHYARAMASWGVLLALCDFRYDGPEESMGFSPKITPEHFSSFFSAAEGWGDIAQTRVRNIQTNAVALTYGRLPLRRLSFALPARYRSATLKLNGQPVAFKPTTEDLELHIAFGELQLKAGDRLTLQTNY